jgi:hypothetical protein
MQTFWSRVAIGFAIVALIACADRGDAPTSPPGNGGSPALSANSVVPDCGFEGGAACAPLESGPRCDRGLALDNRGTPLNTGDDRCINDDRHLVGADFRGTWADWALANQRILAIDEPINWVMHLTTHNAFNNWADGYILDPNQVWSMSDQLDLGSRMLWLDLHWFNGLVRLCHGADLAREGEQHVGCSPLDRSFGFGIQEISEWLEANDEEIVILDFEAYVEGHTDEVIEPLNAFFKSKVLTRTDRTALGNLWPSRRQLLAMDKQVIIGALGVEFGGLTHNGYMPASQGIRYVKNFAVEKTGGIVVSCTTVETNPDTPETRQTLLLANDQFRVIGEDRTALLWLSADHPGLVEPDKVADLAACNIPLISFDLLSASRDPGIDFADREPNEEMQPYAVWSWRTGDRGDGGNAAVLRGSDGRWSSAAPAGRHRFACARPRSETTRNASDWTDRVSRTWRVTTRDGEWKEGGRACLDEFGNDGFVFSVPVNGFANGQLRLADPARGDVWLNYNDIKQDGDWIINRRPLASAGADQVVECNNHHGATLQLDGRLSSDPDGDAVQLEWSGPFGKATGMQPTVTLPLGRHVITVVADDGFGGASRDEVVIEVVDTTPPEIHSAVPTPNTLWPPNHKMRSTVITVDVTDICDANPTCRIVSVTSNEPANSVGDGNTEPDWEITGALTLNVRAERSGTGTGRVYTITVRCSDISGIASTTEVKVNVPHDQGG